MIIFRALCKEVFLTMLVMLAILLFIFITNDSVHYLNRAADGKISISVMSLLMLSQIPLLIGYLLPVSLFFSLMLTLGRWAVDRETIALMASGVGRMKLISWVMTFATVISILVGCLVLWIEPRLQSYRIKMIAQALIRDGFANLTSGRFQTLDRRGWVFYAGRLNRHDQQMDQVFLANKKLRWDVILADHVSAQEQNQQHYLVLHNGERYEGVPGQYHFDKTSFEQYGILLSQELLGLPNPWHAKSTASLWAIRAHDLKAAAELQWRISMPLSVEIFAFLAIPLSRGYAQRRFGKFAAFLPAILIFLIYADLLFVGRSWIENGWLPPQLGLWGIHGALFVLALFLMRKNA